MSREVNVRKATPTLSEAIERSRAELMAFARRRVGLAAEDVVQQASVQALEKADQLVSPEAARAWLFAIVRQVVAQQGRVREVASDEIEITAESTEPPDACGCVMTQIKELSPKQAELLTRVVVEGADVDELAKELGITRNNTWVRLHRAREALRKQLKDHCGAESLRQCLGCGCLERGCCR
ncbi:MAG: sigma factor-like helix-turn-helix DNA-binding protein [Archangium sp.]